MRYAKSIPFCLAAAVACAGIGPVWAVPVIDGKADAEYGAALSTQNTNTQFGNATSGDSLNAGGGSEIDQVFARVSGGRLNVLIAGNLETNFNKLEVFIDSEAGGVNTIDGSALPGGVDPFCCGGFPPPNGTNDANNGALQRLTGLTFDQDFTADHYLSFTHGFENALAPNNLTFYAASAHYAKLTSGTAGAARALGMQLAPHGLPNVLRGTTRDFNTDGRVDGADFLAWQQNAESNIGVTRNQGDADGNGIVDSADLAAWSESYGFNAATSPFDANYFAPQNAAVDNSDALVSRALPGLSQGDLIDKTYALGPGGATDNAGTGAVTRELEFVLPPVAGTTNAASHRDMQNIVDLKMAIDNSNTQGVTGDAPYEVPTTDPSQFQPGNPQDVKTGIEFSIPLTVLDNPTGAGIKLLAFINGTGHDFMSNQVSGAGVLRGNLGSVFPNFEIEFVPGENQYVSVPNPTATANAVGVPEPGALPLLALSAIGLTAAVRRR